MEDKERTLYCGNLCEKVTEDLLYELFLQAGPLENVTIPKDKDGRPRNFAFIAFKHPVSVQYAIALMNGISLFGRPLRLDARSGSNEVNPYLQKLQEYALSASTAYQQHNQGFYPMNDNRHKNENRYHQNDTQYHNNNRYSQSRRNEPRSENTHVLYPSYNQPYFLPQIPPPPVNLYFNPNPYGNHQNSRSGYRR